MKRQRRSRKDTLRTSCILANCCRRIPLKRQRRGAITCTPKHGRLLTKLRKQERDRRVCDKCGRPCTPGEKSEFRRWRVSREANNRAMPAKGIRASATTIKTHAYVCPEPSRKRGKRRLRR